MERWSTLRRWFVGLVGASFLLLIFLLILLWVRSPFPSPSALVPHHASLACELHPLTPITPLNGTPHLLVSAYLDGRVKGGAVRIISVFRRNSDTPLFCYHCCGTHWVNGGRAQIQPHSDHFGFPFATTDVLCGLVPGCNSSHVGLSPTPLSDRGPLDDHTPLINPTSLPIRNRLQSEVTHTHFQFNFTVCISSLFGEYNNVLQFTQSLEMYRLLGVDRVVVYQTSCGAELQRLLQGYAEEGFVELVPWPIQQHLQPSRGWNYDEHGGDLHYYGQLTTLNECVYRSMHRSRFVLLHDIDEIVVPYKHNDLMQLMEQLQQQSPRATVFLIENHIFPKKHFEPSGRFHLPQWEGVLGVNILQHIYREEPDRKIYHPYKMVVQPRAVFQTSVHSVLQHSGQTVKVSPEVCRLVHVRVPLQGKLTLEQLHPDTRLWDFSDRLIPRVDRALRKAGLLH